jgi:hypothetical protein
MGKIRCGKFHLNNDSKFFFTKIFESYKLIYHFQNIEDLKYLLKNSVDANDDSNDRSEKHRLEVGIVKEEEEIDILEKDLEEVEQIIQSLGSNLTEKTRLDFRKMLTGASVFLGKLEKQLDDLKTSQNQELDGAKSAQPVKDVEDLLADLQVPTKEEFEHFTLPFYFDRESDKHQHGRKTFDSEKDSVRKIGAEIDIKPITGPTKEEQAAQAFEDDEDDPITIAVISVSIIVVAGILVTVLAVYCCKRRHYQSPGSNQGSFAFTSDDFEKEEDVYLEDFGEGDFFEWPKTPLRQPLQQQQRQQPQHHQQQQQRQQQQQQQRHQIRQQQHVIVEYSRGYSEGYCRLISGTETTQL